MTCNFEDCQEAVKYKGLCGRHYARVTTATRRGGYTQVGDFCKRGHKIEGDNAQFYMNHGVQRVRCAICNQFPSNKVKIGDTCNYGHKIEGENITRIKRDGKELFRCRECTNARYRDRRERARQNGTIEELRAHEARRRREWKEKNKPSFLEKEAQRADRILLTEVSQGATSFSALKYLKLGKRAAQASKALEDAFDKAKAKCYSYPRAYIDYQEGDEPTNIQAYKLCEGCPLLVECGRFAAAYCPPIGVWAGEVWVDGKVRR